MNKKGFLYVPKWQELLIALLKKTSAETITTIAFELDLPSSEVNDLLNMLKEHKLVETLKLKRTVLVKLSRAGKKVAYCCQEIKKAVK